MEQLDSNKLKGILKEYQITQQQFADILGLTLTTVNKRIKTIESFTLRDIMLLADHINMPTHKLIKRLTESDPIKGGFF